MWERISNLVQRTTERQVFGFFGVCAALIVAITLGIWSLWHTPFVLTFQIVALVFSLLNLTIAMLISTSTRVMHERWRREWNADPTHTIKV